jgi:excinuclease ABC subunit C
MSDSPTDAPLKGPARIEAYLKTLPDAPGVYRMLNDKGDVLYVGKAKNLKKRVTSYARGAVHSDRLMRMIADTAEMIFVTTASEIEALLLESNLIKRLKPRYNVSYRDDKSFPNILLRQDHPFPQLLKHRGAKSTKGVYFGPFASAGAVTRTLNTLQRAFLLRSCSDSVFESRTRPCLLFQIKRCSAPCVGRVDEAGYAELVREAEEFLNGKSRTVQDDLARQMNTASDQLDFEAAARFRDRIKAMSHIQSQQGINPTTFAEADVIAAYQQGGETCIQVFFFRAGQNWGNRPYFPRHPRETSCAEVLEAFVAQFYDERPAPRAIFLSEDIANRELIEEAFRLKSDHAVEIAVPQRGEKREIVEMALQNAREQLARRMAENSAQRELLEGVCEVFGMEAPPKRIEVYDNSHIQGTNALGGMIVAGPDGFEKGEYRKFNIKSTELTPGDDYGMMREVLTRRFTRLANETDEEVEAEDEGTGMPEWPDVVFIDGGAGQMSAVRGVIAEMNLQKEVIFIGIAKGEERDAGREKFFMEGREAFMLPHRDPVLYYVQRLRDEAHRFAIGTHRAKRKKDAVANPLDEIEGIGPTRKRALLNHFGSAKATGRASLADLQAVPGISSAMAQLIYDHFNRTD